MSHRLACPRGHCQCSDTQPRKVEKRGRHEAGASVRLARHAKGVRTHLEEPGAGLPQLLPELGRRQRLHALQALRGGAALFSLKEQIPAAHLAHFPGTRRTAFRVYTRLVA